MQRRSVVSAPVLMILVVLVSLVVQGSATAAPLSGTRVTGWASAPSTVTAGGVYSASVTASGGARPVLLQQRTGTAWRTVETARADRRGRVTLTWALPLTAGLLQPRVLDVRVRVPRTATHAGAVTGVRGLTVRVGLVDTLLGTVLTLVNVARSVPRSCGDQRYPAVRPLRRNARLDRAADRFAHLMARRDFFAHDSPGGAGPGDRIRAAGYAWRVFGENIAAGYPTPAEVVTGWLDSPGHCRNLMGRFTEIGLGHAYDPGSTYGSYWVQDLASRQ